VGAKGKREREQGWVCGKEHTVCNEAAKVTADNTVPGWAFTLIELFTLYQVSGCCRRGFRICSGLGENQDRVG
jgi:hypothetical protein